MSAQDGKVVSLTGAFSQWQAEALGVANMETILLSTQGLEGLKKILEAGIVQPVDLSLSAISTAIAAEFIP